MKLASMTGFARAHGDRGPWRFAWELKTVNSKGLDLRLRVPPGFDAVEIKARGAIGARLARGACSAGLTAKREDSAGLVRIDKAALGRLLAALDDVPLRANLQPASLDGLLAIRGVVEFVEPEDSEEERAALDAQALACLDEALARLIDSRHAEGEALKAVLHRRLDRIAFLTEEANQLPARRPEAIEARLRQQIAMLLENANAFDPQRLHQEAVLIAVKTDIREELDRLAAHVASARALLASGGPIGRRLDFLAQEFSRETNTLCAKSNDPSLTEIGLELKIEVEQLREQVQNIE
ncbi:YicC/YloC family endoribonuclease [Methylocystis heyeri]|uniref:YicC family protein n=1 Tax=Methylocystis heyeri TaxID=391905 RepID=A0A6B8KGV8_9HYPH|nr:YicC/YloC family endoribonuclease [Methylocystis heyeri]QGM47604.1 YicC family protein [Methylocystis heyeri]